MPVAFESVLSDAAPDVTVTLAGVETTVNGGTKVNFRMGVAVGFNNNQFVAVVGTKSDMRCIIGCRNRETAIVQFCSLLLRLYLRWNG
jgi:hypothetical protein